MDIDAKSVRKQMYNTLVRLRATCLLPDGTPTERFLEFLMCNECSAPITTRPVRVYAGSLHFLCKECVTPEIEKRLILIPQNYFAKIRMPCRWGFRGCPEFPFFGREWTMHESCCLYPDAQIPFLDERWEDPDRDEVDDFYGPQEVRPVHDPNGPKRIIWRNVIEDYFRRKEDESDNDDDYREGVYQEPPNLRG